MFLSIDHILDLRLISEYGSLNKAALNSTRSKSSLNYSIKILEEQLGFTVLSKEGYRVKLTEKGKDFLYKSKDLIKSYDELIESSKQIYSGVETKISISASGICALDRLYNVMKSTMKKYPQTQINFQREILSGEYLLENDEVDIALFEHLKNKSKFEYKELYNLKLPLVISSKNDFLKLKKKDQTFENLKRIPHIIQSSTVDTNIETWKSSEDEINWKVNDILSKSELICEGLGWGRLPMHLIEKKLKKGELVHLKHLDDLKSMKVYLCRKKNKSHGVVSNYIWDSFINTI